MNFGTRRRCDRRLCDRKPGLHRKAKSITYQFKVAATYPRAGRIETWNGGWRLATVLATNFETLLSLWSKDRRAKGGWWALAGFSFQSIVYLLRFFEGVHKGAILPADLA